VARRPPLPRDPVPATVDGFTHGGEGVVRIEGKAVFVPGTIPGERVVVRVTDDRKRWARAELVEVVEPSPDRVTPPCPYVPDCGGCDLQHVAPPAQRRLKTRVVREQLERLGGLTDPPVADCRPVGDDVRYRTHARLHADDDGRLGFHRAGSHDVVPIADCLVLSEPAQRLREEVGDDTGAAEVVVRAHPSTSTRAVVLHPGPGGLDLPGGDADLLLAQPDGTTAAIRGDGVLRERVGDVELAFDATSFFQVSPGAAEAIVTEVLAAAGDVSGLVVWDLYAGVGLLAVPLARAGAEVLAVEGHAASAEHARANAEANDATVRVEARDVRDVVRRLTIPGEVADVPDVVVLDPPRSGAGEDVCAALAAAMPARIVYVSCDPAALARDAAVFAEHGYRLRHAQPLDLFPMTHHVETVATFTT
jgi:tRNA/tmRNA/rRNA uracil-C5-methylase (TrmA/RlmC/RlmD family)